MGFGHSESQQKIVKDPKLRAAMLEELEALDKNKT
jgi:hypothetical protein